MDRLHLEGNRGHGALGDPVIIFQGSIDQSDRLVLCFCPQFRPVTEKKPPAPQFPGAEPGGYLREDTTEKGDHGPGECGMDLLRGLF